MNDAIRNAFERGNLVLVLGAGCSLTSNDGQGNNLPSGERLAEDLAVEFGMNFNGELLGQVYSSAKKRHEKSVDDYFEDRFSGCAPSKEYLRLASYPWARIYTLNIDDAFDRALEFNSKQKVRIRHRNDRIEDQDQTHYKLDYVKLNGCAKRMQDGIIFSEKEYAYGSAQQPLWYQELARDYYRNVFVFIGTKFTEPLFKHQIERYRIEKGADSAISYVLVPSMTEIEIDNIGDYNIQHIEGTLGDFVGYMDANYSSGVDISSIATKKNPHLSKLLSMDDDRDRQGYVELFKDVTIVTNGMEAEYKDVTAGEIRKFYKGFKPTWEDIVHEVPALTHNVEKFLEGFNAWYVDPALRVGAIVGQAGSGKTTLLKQVSYIVSKRREMPVYYVEGYPQSFIGLVRELERVEESEYLLCLDRLSSFENEIADLTSSGRLKKGIIIGCESKRTWQNRTRAKIGDSFEFEIELINKEDAIGILDKLEKYGPWTRLSKKPQADRIREIYEKSRRQLLIGLLEATMGRGFEDIIEKDYNALSSLDEKKFVVLVGLATKHRFQIKEDIVQRAMDQYGISGSVRDMYKKTSDIVTFSNGQLMARHHVYVGHLFSSVVEKTLLRGALKSLLMAYTFYEAPVIKNAPKGAADLFKRLINHKFIIESLNAHQEAVVSIYRSLEKHFEVDGLYWNQYGLALRQFGLHEEAHEKLRFAIEAHPHPHTEHALAQQELILAYNCESKEKAISLLDSSIDRLQKLSVVIKSDDTYPIVTQSEGHVKIVKKYFGLSQSQEIAKKYANQIGFLLKKGEDTRLKQAFDDLVRFYTTGVMKNDNIVSA